MQRRIYNGTNGTSVPGLPLKMRIIEPIPFLNFRGQPFLQREVMGKNFCMNLIRCFEQLSNGQELHGREKDSSVSVEKFPFVPPPPGHALRSREKNCVRYCL